MNIAKRFLAGSGVLYVIALVANVLPVDAPKAVLSSYYAGVVLILAASLGLLVLGAASWAWLTFNQGKKGEGEMASAANRVLAALVIVAVFVLALAGVAQTFAIFS